MNAIQNCPVTIKQIELAEQIFGPDLGRLKGKTTRTKPKPVSMDYIHIPEELINTHCEVELSIDTIKVNGILFLTTVSRNIKYRTAQPISSKHMSVYRSALDTVF